ncbi:putative glutamine ABC transporter permease protein GlnP [compost metagenome]|jgi:aspartate/glutamate/glutamine transport system permease protein|uniref:Amino acid ABC transporter membrane protein 2, PAAT family (TC 3.A.1.3.-) n=1 Tax=Clostridium intestinale DSM 6191 TaxID=1121320 RepID=A0A1M5XKM3_9CLOT|nr:amino acid ABC transporter permease [Clostridium intestinale]WRY49692.1 amino acid ABC transporter permease [Clostridium intestinale]SHI00108.1 amino acid ABC transporter membrane protein 2, PAAT family (TC 3.A.1.3.-) [Clostridium intestinale DSM 6191]
MIKEVLNPVNIKFLLQGFSLTLYISVISILLSIVFGTILGVLRSSSKGILGKLSSIYIEVVRNTPLLLWIFFIRFVFRMPAVNAGILAFTIFTTAIIGEVVRGGLSSVKKGQWEAAQSQGFNTFQTLRYVILPQAFKNMIPAILSQFVTVIKDTSFLWAVGVEEITGKSMILMGAYATPTQVFTLYTTVALIYFVVNYLISIVFRAQHARLSLQG